MKKILLPAMIFICLCLSMLACNTKNNSTSTMKFTFEPDTASDYENNQKIYINEDTDLLTLHSNLKLASGKLSIRLINMEQDTVAWSGEFTEDTSFDIEINDVKADTEYVLYLQAIKTDKMILTVTSETKLVQHIMPPVKPEPIK